MITIKITALMLKINCLELLEVRTFVDNYQKVK